MVHPLPLVGLKVCVDFGYVLMEVRGLAEASVVGVSPAGGRLSSGMTFPSPSLDTHHFVRCAWSFSWV